MQISASEPSLVLLGKAPTPLGLSFHICKTRELESIFKVEGSQAKYGSPMYFVITLGESPNLL